MTRTHFEVKETALTVVCDDRYLRAVRDAVYEARERIESRIAEDPFFGITYDPIPPRETDDPVTRGMCQASVSAGVGPMAAVAGAVAQHAVKAAVGAGCGHIIVDNGGDICLRTSEPVRIGIHSAEPGFSDLAYLIPPTHGLYGVCSSSGRIGPSVSFGSGGVCTVFSPSAVLADACATAFGNRVGGCGEEEMSAAAEGIASIAGVEGCSAIGGGRMAMCGKVPEIVGCGEDESLITRIEL